MTLQAVTVASITLFETMQELQFAFVAVSCIGATKPPRSRANGGGSRSSSSTVSQSGISIPVIPAPISAISAASISTPIASFILLYIAPA